MAHEWYVIQVLSGWEQKVKETLEKRIQMEGMQERILRILIPTESVSEVKSGKKKISKRKFFPGYILLQMEITEESWYFVTETNGILGFPGLSGSFRGNPVPLLEQEMEGILDQSEGTKEKVKPKIHFDKGENIKVTDGPFVNFSGVVDEVNPDRGKLKVMVLIFGRSTPVELEYWQVERI
jgi:transcriptional antiterminator NusG